MRWALLTFLILVTVILVACDPGITMTVVNNTDVPICWYSSGNYGDGKNFPDTTDPKYCMLVEPGGRCDAGVLCHSDSMKWVVLTLGVGGQEIYAKSATCGEWEEAGATVVLDQRDGEYIVRDGVVGSH
jgi:hypothetical protein